MQNRTGLAGGDQSALPPKKVDQWSTFASLTGQNIENRGNLGNAIRASDEDSREQWFGRGNEAAW